MFTCHQRQNRNATLFSVCIVDIRVTGNILVKCHDSNTMKSVLFTFLCFIFYQKYKCCLYVLWNPSSLISFHLKSDKEIHLGLHVKCLTLLSNLNRSLIYLSDFHKSPPIKFQENPPSGSQDDTCGKMA